MKKYPLVGALLNLFIPGLAYAYVGRWGRALLEFIGAVLGLGALLFAAGLLESTNPPWPDGLTQLVLLGLFYLGMLLEGARIVRRHNESGAAAGAHAQPSSNRTLVMILLGIIIVLCGLLVVVVAMSGILEKNEDTAVTAPLPAPTSTLATASQPEATAAEPGPTVETEAKAAEAPEPTDQPPPQATEEMPSEPRAVVTNDRLNIRSGPGTGYPIIGALLQGDEVTVTGRNKASTWLAIRTDDGTEGWVYADYTRVDTEVKSLPVAQAAPPPASSTPAEPTATLTVDEQIAKVARGEHGTLPQPGEVGGVDADGEAEVTILNDTPYQLTVLIGSPNSRKVVIEACSTCKVYSMVGPMFCQEEGRPRQTIRLAPGTMEVVARVPDKSVTPFYGTWELKANTGYFNCFYIVTSFR
jgi:uncharacterized protein YgiM (DUF1202 family)